MLLFSPWRGYIYTISDTLKTVAYPFIFWTARGAMRQYILAQAYVYNVELAIILFLLIYKKFNLNLNRKLNI